jgi:hypothetical protein
MDSRLITSPSLLVDYFMLSVKHHINVITVVYQCMMKELSASSIRAIAALLYRAPGCRIDDRVLVAPRSGRRRLCTDWRKPWMNSPGMLNFAVSDVFRRLSCLSGLFQDGRLHRL